MALPRTAARLNPHLAINPPVEQFGNVNAVLTGTSRRYHVADFRGPLSLKATLAGTATWRVQERDCRVSESTYIVVNADDPYTIRFDEFYDVTTFCLFFRNGYVEQLNSALSQSMPAMLDDPFCARAVEFPLKMHSGSSTVLERLRSFARELENGLISDDVWELRFGQLATSLLLESKFAIPKAESIWAAKRSTREELLKRVSMGRDFLLSLSDRPIVTEDAAKAACMSAFHFHRVFRQTFGIPPHVFLRNHRMARAAHMLQFTSAPIEEIVQRVGLTSVGSFTAAFKEVFGMTPSRYRATKRRP